MPKFRSVRAWIDMTEGGVWGVEVDDPRLTMDGHYICRTGPGELGERLAMIVADALNGRRTPKMPAQPGDPE